MHVVQDQTSAPTWTRDVAEQIDRIAKSRLGGVVHAVSEGGVSKFLFAQEISSRFNLPMEIVPASSADFPGAAPRPVYSVLDNTRLRREGINCMRTYTEALNEFATMELAHEQ